MAEEKKTGKKLLAALAAGAAIGAGIALLFSPKRGRELRAQIRESALSLKEQVEKQRSEKGGQVQERPLPVLSSKGLGADYDIIIVGGGHNGLVCAAYLAKAGRTVLVLERREIVGGAAVTEELIPGFQCSSLTDDSGFLSSKIIKDLDLARHGLKFTEGEPLIFSPMPDGTSLTIWSDVERTAAEIGRFSQKDAASYPSFVEQMGRYSQIISRLKSITPPDLPDIGVRDLVELRSIAGSVRDLGGNDLTQALRILPMPVADLLNEWFESDVVKGVIAASAVKDISLGPREAGTAYMLLHNWSGSNGQLLPYQYALGGTGALSQILASTAVSHGAVVRTDSKVSRIVAQNGQAVGVELAAGEKISAAAVVSAVDMRSTFLKLVDPYYLDRSFVQHVRNIKYRGTAARMHFALNRLPTFRGLNGNASQILTGRIQLAPSMTYLQKAYDPVKYGRSSEEPYLDMHIPSLSDPSRAPTGQHLMSVTVKYMPYSMRDGSWAGKTETIAQLVIETISKYAADFSVSIKEVRLISPLDMESIYGQPEGNLAHGEMTLDRFLWMRPIPGYAQYRAPIKDLYMCSSATHPGGGITGINGRNAAREILKDWK